MIEEHKVNDLQMHESRVSLSSTSAKQSYFMMRFPLDSQIKYVTRLSAS